MAQTYRDTLIKARDLIADPNHWTDHRGAADAMGNTCDPLDEEACAWCATAAVYKAAGNKRAGRPVQGPLAFLDWQARSMGYVSAQDLNDRGGHRAVLHMFEGALAKMASQTELKERARG